MIREGFIASALSLVLIFGSMGAGSSASAEGPASVFYGYVFANGDESPPSRVRALSASGAVCGTADVLPSTAGSGSVGFYAIAVASSEQKAGCPSLGAVVQFTLLASRVDDGQWADQIALARPGETPQQINLGAAARSFPGWASAASNLQGQVVLRWIGADGTSLAGGLESLGIVPASVARPNSDGAFTDADPAGKLAAGDLVLVRLP
jgi:hypothetical protein